MTLPFNVELSAQSISDLNKNTRGGVYLAYSQTAKAFRVGQSGKKGSQQTLYDRLSQHAGKPVELGNATERGRPWVLVWAIPLPQWPSEAIEIAESCLYRIMGTKYLFRDKSIFESSLSPIEMRIDAKLVIPDLRQIATLYQPTQATG